MIKIQKISRVFILFLVVTGLFSCGDDDNTRPFDLIGDVFVTKRMIDDEAQYALSYYAYGNEAMSAASVTTPDATEVTLSAANSMGNTWSKTATLSDFSMDYPTEGIYSFYVLNEDVPHEVNDYLTLHNSEFTEIVSSTMENSVLSVEWDENLDSEGHLLRLLTESGEVVFTSQFLSTQVSRLDIDPNTASGTWVSGHPKTGDFYTLEIHSFTFDSDASDLDFSYHIDEIAITEQLIPWQ